MDKKILVIAFFMAFAGAVIADSPENPGKIFQQTIKSLQESENHLGILGFIDSLRNEGIQTPEISWHYATALYTSGRLSQARDSLLLWENDSVYSYRARNMLTQIAIQQNNYMEAVKFLIKLKVQFPQNPVYPLRLARVFRAMDQLSGAEAQYAAAFKLDTLNQVVIAEWVDVLIKLEFLRRASWILDNGIKISPDNLGFRRQKVSLAYLEKKYASVLENAQYLLERGDTIPQMVKLKAFALYHMDSIDRAEEWIDYLLNNDFTAEDVFYYKGRILAAKNMKNDAQYYLRLATIACLSANFNTFSLQAGINLHESGQYQESIRWLQMTRMFSQNPLITYYLALNFYTFYEDKIPALNHFRLFVDLSTMQNQEIYRDYARAKIRELTEESHFRGH
jgi:predicted Zn-dependent protease